MKKISLLLTGLLLLLLFSGCPNFYGYKYSTGKLPDHPINFAVLNSPFDDYNMSSPVIDYNRYLYFSSNRNSSGGQFDIIGENVHLEWSKDEGDLVVDAESGHYQDMRYVDTLFRRMNSEYNELGPYSLPYLTRVGNRYNFTDMVVYANDESGDLDLKLVSFSGEGENPAPYYGTYTGPIEVSGVNSPADDAYLCFFGPGFVNWQYGSQAENITEIYLCSNRGGNFDIYFEILPAGADIVDFLVSDTTKELKPVDMLNSGYQDKCPYIDGNLLVFTSDRPGGYGGFDLYYSRRTGTSWSEPVNFGDKINTEYDEYRPIVFVMNEFEEDMMLFSSNRPGGRGGYDLYYVGIQKMIE